jgi:uncharacterized protein (DUF849 family)
MTTPCIITVAITGSLPQAGATLVHAHVRKDDGSPASDPERFGALVESLRKHCPGMIIQLSTGGRSGARRERFGVACVFRIAREAPCAKDRIFLWSRGPGT